MQSGEQMDDPIAKARATALAKYAALVQQANAEHAAKLKDLAVAQQQTLDAIANRCLHVYGEHKDDGSMFYGFCVRCGVEIG